MRSHGCGCFHTAIKWCQWDSKCFSLLDSSAPGRPGRGVAVSAGSWIAVLLRSLPQLFPSNISGHDLRDDVWRKGHKHVAPRVSKDWDEGKAPHTAQKVTHGTGGHVTHLEVATAHGMSQRQAVCKPAKPQSHQLPNQPQPSAEGPSKTSRRAENQRTERAPYQNSLPRT